MVNGDAVADMFVEYAEAVDVHPRGGGHGQQPGLRRRLPGDARRLTPTPPSPSSPMRGATTRPSSGQRMLEFQGRPAGGAWRRRPLCWLDETGTLTRRANIRRRSRPRTPIFLLAPIALSSSSSDAWDFARRRHAVHRGVVHIRSIAHGRYRADELKPSADERPPSAIAIARRVEADCYLRVDKQKILRRHRVAFRDLNTSTDARSSTPSSAGQLRRRGARRRAERPGTRSRQPRLSALLGACFVRNEIGSLTQEHAVEGATLLARVVGRDKGSTAVRLYYSTCPCPWRVRCGNCDASGAASVNQWRSIARSGSSRARRRPPPPRTSPVSSSAADAFMKAWTTRHWISDAASWPVAPQVIDGMYATHLAMQTSHLAAELGGVGGYKIGAVGAEETMPLRPVILKFYRRGRWATC